MDVLNKVDSFIKLLDDVLSTQMTMTYAPSVSAENDLPKKLMELKKELINKYTDEVTK